MSAPKVSFQVRLRSRSSLGAVTARVTAALGGDFQPVANREFDPGEAMEAALLGLVVDIIGDPSAAEGEEVTYIVRGLTRPDVEAELEVDAPTISIGEFVLAVMRTVDDPGWYIADERELRDEAGV